jgi:GDP-L-galactose phosphorylase
MRNGAALLRKACCAQVCGLVFESGGNVEHLAAVVGEACQRLSAANIPHNLFVVDCGQRVFLFPNAFARAKAQGTVPEDLLDSQVLFLNFLVVL